MTQPVGHPVGIGTLVSRGGHLPGGAASNPSYDEKEPDASRMEWAFAAWQFRSEA